MRFINMALATIGGKLVERSRIQCGQNARASAPKNTRRRTTNPTSTRWATSGVPSATSS